MDTIHAILSVPWEIFFGSVLYGAWWQTILTLIVAGVLCIGAGLMALVLYCRLTNGTK